MGRRTSPLLLKDSVAQASALELGWVLAGQLVWVAGGLLKQVSPGSKRWPVPEDTLPLYSPVPALHPPASMPWLPSRWRTSSNLGCRAWPLGDWSSSPRGSVSWGDLGGGPGQPLPLTEPSPSATALIYGSACLTVAALSSLLGGGVLQVSTPPPPIFPRGETSSL